MYTPVLIGIGCYRIAETQIWFICALEYNFIAFWITHKTLVMYNVNWLKVQVSINDNEKRNFLQHD